MAEEKESLMYSFTAEEFSKFEENVNPFDFTNTHADILEKWMTHELSLAEAVEQITKDCKNKWEFYVAISNITLAIRMSQNQRDPISQLMDLLNKR